ncbi:F0F1 ATP synthase subunit epsilon [Schlesneria paludicola]|uniref:F0F1 ATP synthase subunit epsilon n=1 Tax=Schlesneria paludicola TaxID=360056 RepID=UPI00029B3F71|nr:F0F1 ATP synthase subunit epsilon [Schlesneria paludicola]
MAGGDKLRLIVVTPERTLLDEPVSALRFPLYDGDIGILPGRLPLIGRLGVGELHVTKSTGEEHYFVDGGFVQVLGPNVTLLTDRAIPAADLSAADAAKQLEAALSRPAKTDEEVAAKFAEQQRARRMLALAQQTH